MTRDLRRRVRLYAAEILDAQEQTPILDHLGILDPYSEEAEQAMDEWARVIANVRRSAGRG